MKLGIIARPEMESFDYAKSLGLEFVEFDVNCAPEFMLAERPEAAKNGTNLLARADEFNAAVARTGVAVGAVGRWASKIIDTDGGIIEKEFEQVKALIDFAKKTGAGAYLVSVNYVPELSYYKNITAAINYLNKAVEYAGDSVKVATVNCMMGGNYIRTPEQWKLVHSEVPGLGIKYDPSHSFVHGGPNGAYMEEAFEWGDKFAYVHIKGVVQGSKQDEAKMWKYMNWARECPGLMELVRPELAEDGKYYDNPPAGLDAINWRAFMAILYKHGYDGMLSIEPHSATWRGELGDRGLKFTIDYMRSLMI